MKPNRRKGAWSGIFFAIGDFFKNIAIAFVRFDRKERVIFMSLALVLITLLALEARKLYFENTKLVASSGGEYVETIGGDAKYFSPVLAKSDAEKAVSHLVYSALVKVDETGKIVPDLATSWEVSGDGLSYTFHLRNGVTFQNGKTFDSSDVAATVAAIQDETNKSPLRETWKDITVETPDAATAVLKLPKSYGPFIYACTLEIIDSEDAVSGSLSSSYNGSGPYTFSQAVPDGNNNMTVTLRANKSYYGGAPLISTIRFLVAKDQAVADRLAKDYTLSATSALGKKDGFKDVSFKTGRELVLFFNTKKDTLKDINTRKKLLNGESFTSPLHLVLLTTNAEPQKSRAEQFAQDWKSKGVEVELKISNTTDYAESVKKRDYDLLLYGWDWAYDRDPYPFWHSSQVDKNNFAGYSDKATDIALEDARLILDPVERTKRYEAIYQKIKDNALAIYYSQEIYPCYFGDMVKKVDIKSSYGRPEDRFNNIGNWYITEKRVKKTD